MKDTAERIAAAVRTAARFEEEQGLGDVEAGLAAQDLVTDILGSEFGGVGGYKIAWNAPALMEKFGLPHPGYGRVLKDMIRDTGAELPAGDYMEFLMEPEIAAVLASDMPAVEGGYDAASVLPHVARFVPAFELLDRRGGSASMHVPTILAGNVFNKGAVLGGPGVSSDTALTGLETVVTIGGEEVLRKMDAAPQAPAEALAFIANRFNARGVTPKAGEIVLLGAHMPLTPVPAGSEAVMRVTGLGEVRFTIG